MGKYLCIFFAYGNTKQKDLMMGYRTMRKNMTSLYLGRYKN